MKIIFIWILVLIFPVVTFTQTIAQPVLDDFNKARINISKKGLFVLGSFAAGNLVTSGIAWGNANGESRYFHRMNTMISAVNLGLSGISIIVLQRKNYKGSTLSTTLKDQNKGEDLFLFNTGLDVAYIVGGFLLKEKSKTSGNPAKYRGYGNAVLYQGSALFLFDGIMFLLLKNHGGKLIKMHEKLELQISPGTVGFRVKF